MSLVEALNRLASIRNARATRRQRPPQIIRMIRVRTLKKLFHFHALPGLLGFANPNGFKGEIRKVGVSLSFLQFPAILLVQLILFGRLFPRL